MASITCGNCQKTHASVADVKACYGGKAVETTGKHRSNQHPGTCYRCGARVDAKAGALERGERGWTVRHLDGECPAKALADPKQHAPARKDYSAIPQGYYATATGANGENDIEFWFVKEGRKHGYRFVKRIIGGQGPIQIHTSEALRALDAIIAEGVDKCGDRFADEMKACRKCNIHLTRKASRVLRYGPECANNVGLGAEWTRLDKKFGHADAED